MSDLRFDTISFLSDYGLADEFVGVVKSVIRSIEPGVTVVDVTHDIPAHDVRAGGLALARAAQYLVPGVVLAVVDPGVGTDRRGIAVEVGDGQSVLVGPDNGLLAPAVALVGGATRVVALEAPDLRLPSGGATFDGRDLFAPVAAQLCAGRPLDELGPDIDPALLQPGMMSLAEVDDGVIAAQVLWVDRFGNLQLNVGPDDLEPLAADADRVRVILDGDTRVARRVEAFGELGGPDLGLVLDSYGLLALALDQRSAAEELRLAAGDGVRLEPLGEDDDGPGVGDDDGGAVSTPVDLGSTRR
jgi:S-adenosylmethionine hydrolase